MQNQTIIDESGRCDHPNNEPIIYRSSNFDIYDGVMHRIANDTPSIIQSSTSHAWYTNNGGAIAIDVSSIRSKN